MFLECRFLTLSRVDCWKPFATISLWYMPHRRLAASDLKNDLAQRHSIGEFRVKGKMFKQLYSDHKRRKKDDGTNWTKTFTTKAYHPGLILQNQYSIIPSHKINQKIPSDAFRNSLGFRRGYSGRNLPTTNQQIRKWLLDTMGYYWQQFCFTVFRYNA